MNAYNELLDELLAEENTKYEPMQEGDVTVKMVMEKLNMNHETAFQRLEDKVTKGELVKFSGLFNGRPLNIYRKKNP